MKKNSALLASFVCTVLACALLAYSEYLFFLYGPLLIAAFVLSIVAMASRRVFWGIVAMFLSIVAPPPVFVMRYVINLSNERAAKIEKARIEAEAARNAEAKIAVEKKLEAAAPPAVVAPRRSGPSLAPAVKPVAVAESAEPKADTRQKEPPAPAAPSVTGAFGINFGTVLEKKNIVKQEDDRYYVIPSVKFRTFNHFFVKVTPATNKIYQITGIASFDSAKATDDERKLLISMIKDKYKVEPTGIFRTDFEFHDAEIQIPDTDMLEYASISYIHKQLKAQAEAERIAIEKAKTDTTAL